MKKVNKNPLSFTKETVSNFNSLTTAQLHAVKGGSLRTCSGESLQGGCGTGGPAPSGKPACYDK
ncbi:class I lanthipeptide [Flavobacteriaceae bacterium M23B6Z8]